MILTYVVQNKKYESIHQILKQELKISSRLLQKLISNKYVSLNGSITDTRNPISIGDIITVNLDFEEESENIVPTKMDLDIIFEDEAFLVLNKPAGIAVHPSILHYQDSLSNGVKYYFEKVNLHKKIRPVNRLDLHTSGLIVFAKNEYVQECLIMQMNENLFKKEYIAIVSGQLENQKGSIHLPIARKPNSIIERCVSSDGQDAITDYEVQQRFDNYSVVKCLLRTGRTHQIRVHMAAIGHPLLGDTLYGTASNLIRRQALHSYKISFIHPITHQKMFLQADLPEDMKKVLDM